MKRNVWIITLSIVVLIAIIWISSIFLPNPITKLLQDPYYPRVGLFGGFSVSPNEEEIVFSYFKKGKGSIYSFNPKNAKVVELTKSGKKHYINPVFSPDEEMIIFLSSSYWKKLEQALYVMNRDGTGMKRLTPEEELVTEAIFSPTDERIYYIKAKEFYAAHSGVAEDAHNYDLYSINVDGTDNKQLTHFSSSYMKDLSITSDGRKLGMMITPYDDEQNTINIEKAEETDYFIYDIEQKQFTGQSVPPSGSFLTTFPTMSPDGTMLAYSADPKIEDENFIYEIFERDIKTGQTVQVTNLESNVEEIVYADNDTLYFIYENNYKNETEDNDLRIAKIRHDGKGFEEVVQFNKIMK